MLREQYSTQALVQDASAKISTIIGTIAAKMEEAALARGDLDAAAFWGEGGLGRAALHALAGGLLGGANDVAGMIKAALGGATSALLTPAIKDLVTQIVNSTIADESTRTIMINTITSALTAGMGAAVALPKGKV